MLGVELAQTKMGRGVVGAGRGRTLKAMRDAKVVVITDASAGVGRATAREFGRRGAKVGLLARGTDGLEAARREIEQAGGQAVVVPVDVANQPEVEAAAAEVERALGPIDVWVNNAMTSVFSFS